VPDLPDNPFTLGVASGDPFATSVILWTRLAPAPLDGGGMPDAPAPVRWEVATDDSFSEVVASGTAVAASDHAHSVHVDATGLEPETAYAYRFAIGDYTSPVGRTRTTPEADAAPGSGTLRFAFGSCQDWQNGYYTAYPHLVDDKPELMVWLGDFIYEGGPGDGVRQHNSPKITELAAYRNRYALYTGDENLQAARAACPWIVLWDDHEVENNYAGDNSETTDDTAAFRERRAQAYQAWWEHQPVRLPAPTGPDYQIYRTLQWGSLATFYVLDERQYRTDQPCGHSQDLGATCDLRDEGKGTILGADQFDWFEEEFNASTTTWNVVANEVILTKMPLAGSIFNMDQWDGYPTDQQRMVELFASRPESNPLVITGDIHAYGAADVKLDYAPESPAVGSEFVGGSVTSDFPAELAGLAQQAIEALDQVKFVDVERHGYALVELNADKARCDFRVADTINEPTSGISTSASFEVLAGAPGVRKLD
jgi:alkaline phosphatase D